MTFPVVQALIAGGADVRDRTDQGETCLHCFARWGAPAPMLCLVLQNGGDPTVLNTNYETPADLAEANGHTLAQALLTRAERDWLAAH